MREIVIDLADDFVCYVALPVVLAVATPFVIAIGLALGLNDVIRRAK